MLLKTVVLSRKIQKANNVRKFSQELYILLLKKVNFVKAHHLQKMRDPERNSLFLFFSQKDRFDRIPSYARMSCL